MENQTNPPPQLDQKWTEAGAGAMATEQTERPEAEPQNPHKCQERWHTLITQRFGGEDTLLGFAGQPV